MLLCLLCTIILLYLISCCIMTYPIILNVSIRILLTFEDLFTHIYIKVIFYLKRETIFSSRCYLKQNQLVCIFFNLFSLYINIVCIKHFIFYVFSVYFSIFLLFLRIYFTLFLLEKISVCLFLIINKSDIIINGIFFFSKLILAQSISLHERIFSIIDKRLNFSHISR